MTDTLEEIKARLEGLARDAKVELAHFLLLSAAGTAGANGVSGAQEQSAMEGPEAQASPTTTLDQAAQMIAQLREEVAELQAERDSYLEALYGLMRKEIIFTPEELAQMEKEGMPLGQLIAELEASPETRGNN